MDFSLNNEQRAWQAVEQSRDVARIRSYLSENPGSSFATQSDVQAGCPFTAMEAPVGTVVTRTSTSVVAAIFALRSRHTL